MYSKSCEIQSAACKNDVTFIFDMFSSRFLRQLETSAFALLLLEWLLKSLSCSLYNIAPTELGSITFLYY